MSKFLTAFLICGSLLLSSCGAIRQAAFKPSGIPDGGIAGNLVPFSGSSVYKTDISLGKRNLSGITVFKEYGQGAWRIVFLNELGMKFFDFQLTEDGFEVVSCYEYLNRKKILSLLEQDFSMLLETSGDLILVNHKRTGHDGVIVKEQLSHKKRKYYYLSGNTLLPEKTELMSPWHKKATIIFESYSGNRPEIFSVYHNRTKLDLHFKILDN